MNALNLPCRRTRRLLSHVRCCLGAAALAVLAGMPSSGQPGPGAVVRVGPDGDDAATGDGKLRTLPAALARARTLKPPVTLQLADGQYPLEQTLELTPADSGLTVEAAPGAAPVLSGGRRVTGWVRDPGRAGVWTVDLPEVREGRWYFHQLFLDGARLTRARTPNEGFLRAAGRLGTNAPIEMPFKAGDLKASWASLPDARVVMLMKWTDLHVPLRGVDPEKRVALLAGGPRPYWMDEGDARYWVENVPEALDVAGEWILDRVTGRLSLMLPEGLDPNVARVVAPRLLTLVRVAGDVASKTPVTRVAFRGLTFTETDYPMPADGLISPQAAVPIPGSVVVEHALGGVFERCTFAGLGGYALELGRGAQRWQVTRSEIRDAAAGGIRIGEPGEREPDAFTACRGHEVLDSHLHRLGRVFAPAVGVIVFQSGGNRIVHNEINDLYYTAISVGWNWGYQETPCRENIIEGNHLHHIGQGRLSDMGGVYTLGIQKGTVVRNNLIHDIASYDYGGWGLYTDEGSTGILLENNVVYRCKSSGFHQHYGRENTVRNNIFAFNVENQLMRTRDEDHVSFLFTNNIVYFDSGNLLGSSWKNDRFVINDNVYLDTRAGTDPAKMKFSGATWEQWRGRGHDTRTLIADPRFVDAAGMDFRLRDDSPALKLGFKPIDVSKAGPRKP